MIAVVGTDPNLLETVRQVLDNFDDEHELLGLAEVEARAGRIRAAILCLPILSDAEVEGVATLRARCALLPIFVVTRLNPAAVEAAYKLHGQVALVWTDQVESLPLVLDAHLRKRPFELLF